jgi:hypothetical protein
MLEVIQIDVGDRKRALVTLRPVQFGLFAPLGFVSGVIFSGILVAVERRRSVDRLSLARLAAWGAVSGLLLSGIIVIGAALRGESVWGEFLLFGPPLVLSSAASAAGSLALARKAQRWRSLRVPLGGDGPSDT